jgi:hypothetical protein
MKERWQGELWIVRESLRFAGRMDGWVKEIMLWFAGRREGCLDSPCQGTLKRQDLTEAFPQMYIS